MATSRHLYVIYFLVVLYALSYQLQRPLEPFLVDRLTQDSSSSAASYAQLQSFFGVVQVFGSLVVGALIDKVGLRMAFLLNFLSCAASYVVLANANSMALLFLSKVPTVFMAGFLCAQAAAAKLSPAGDERVAALGRLTASYTIGGTIGPALGGLLGTQVGAWFAVVVSLLAGALAMSLPAEVDEKDGDAAPPAAGAKAEAVGVPPFTERARTVLQYTWPLLWTKFLSATVNSMTHTVQPRILKDNFGVTEKELGMFMSAVFLSTAVVSGVAMKPMMKLFGDKETAVIRTCLGGMAALLFLSANALSALGLSGSGKLAFISLSFLLAMFQYPLATTITARSTSRVPSNVKGTLLGMEHSIHSSSGVVGPTIGLVVVEQFGLAGVPGTGSCMYAALLAAWVLFSTPGSGKEGADATDESKVKLK